MLTHRDNRISIKLRCALKNQPAHRTPLIVLSFLYSPIPFFLRFDIRSLFDICASGADGTTARNRDDVSHGYRTVSVNQREAFSLFISTTIKRA